MTHHKIFYVTTILKIKVILASAKQLENLRSFECVEIHQKSLPFNKNVIVKLMRLQKKLNHAETS